MSERGAIDAYIEALAGRLAGSTIEVHRKLLEVEDHLRESAAAIGDSADAASAEREAIARFGTVGSVARGLNGRPGPVSTWATVRALAGTAAQLGAALLIVAAAGAAVAAAASAVLTRQAVYGLPSNAVPSAANCAHWLAVQPSATGCREAAAFESASDLTMILGALGVIGLLVLAVVWLLRRVGAIPSHTVSPVLGPAVATCGFAATGLVLLIFSVTYAVIAQTWGRGLWISEAACMFAAAAVSAAVWVRAIRGPAVRAASQA